MAPVIDQVRRGITYAEEAVKAFLRACRARWGWFDHLGRAYDRYQEHRGDRLAASLTFYGFLSFFPLVALAFALTGYAVGVSDAFRQYMHQAIDSVLPGLANRVQITQIAQAKEGAGIFGIIGLVWSGLGWIGVWRESLRIIWLGGDEGDNVMVKKLSSLLVLLALGITLLASVALSSVAASATHAALAWAGLAYVPGAATVLRLVAILVAIGANTLIFLVLFSRMSGTRASWRRLVRGCLFGAVGFEILKLTGAYLLAHIMRNPLYASFAVMVGLLLWINIVSRFILFTAAWTATRSVVLSADTPAEPEETADTWGGRPADERPDEVRPDRDGAGGERADRGEAGGVRPDHHGTGREQAGPGGSGRDRTGADHGDRGQAGHDGLRRNRTERERPDGSPTVPRRAHRRR